MATQLDRVAEPQPPLRCANCRITLRDEGVRVSGEDYCCEGCSRGGPCGC